MTSYFAQLRQALPALALLALIPAAAWAQAPAARPKFRVVAPGIETTIYPERQEQDTFSTHDILEILQAIPGDPSFQLSPVSQSLKTFATQTIFRHKVWYLEFTFKPVRMIWVDIPQETGKFQKKLIWYMVYHVKNTGKHFNPRMNQDGTYTVDQIDEEVRFFPQFVLYSPEFKNAYLDRIVPVAIDAIRQKEDPARPLLNSVEIGLKPIPLSSDQVDNSVWGVAMWEDVNSGIDLFSVFVEGLTNAYKWSEQPGLPRKIIQKNLLLNFWRPGDIETEDRRFVQLGIPDEIAKQYKLPEPNVPYRWVRDQTFGDW